MLLSVKSNIDGMSNSIDDISNIAADSLVKYGLKARGEVIINSHSLPPHTIALVVADSLVKYGLKQIDLFRVFKIADQHITSTNECTSLVDRL
ncbi:hypothetical protein LIER_27159 [Lithospermum erythrorhizon]|uniref:Uncharacterized protein n=1 Tax=Lithospermum erythrorhizon TaxID=34254 RepID=A0AAV3REE4_LITER